MIVRNLFSVIPNDSILLLTDTKEKMELYKGTMGNVSACYLDYTVDEIKPCIIDDIFIGIKADIHSYLMHKGWEKMTNKIKLGTLVKYSITTSFCLHDLQYGIIEFYTRSQILENKQLSRMKVVHFKAVAGKQMIHVDVEE